MKKKTTFGLSVILIALAATVCTGCKKDEFTGPSSIKMVTTKAAGEKMILILAADEADHAGVWIDLNNNGKQDDGEKVTRFSTLNEQRTTEYTLGSQTVTLHGKVTELNCRSNQLVALDVSKGTALVDLDCQSNQLTALDVSRNKALKLLFCTSNKLTTLDLSKNRALTELQCYYNQLTALDVSKNTVLRGLGCSDNKLAALDVSKNTALMTLDIDNNHIKLEAMTKLIEGLPVCPSDNKKNGVLRTKGNEFSTTLHAAAARKNWMVIW